MYLIPDNNGHCPNALISLLLFHRFSSPEYSCTSISINSASSSHFTTIFCNGMENLTYYFLHILARTMLDRSVGPLWCLPSSNTIQSHPIQKWKLPRDLKLIFRHSFALLSPTSSFKNSYFSNKSISNWRAETSLKRHPQGFFKGCPEEPDLGQVWLLILTWKRSECWGKSFPSLPNVLWDQWMDIVYFYLRMVPPAQGQPSIYYHVVLYLSQFGLPTFLATLYTNIHLINVKINYFQRNCISSAFQQGSFNTYLQTG